MATGTPVAAPLAEHAELRATVRRFRDEQLATQARDLTDGDRASALRSWTAMAKLGWVGLLVPDAHGGVGAGVVALAVVLEELGYGLAAPDLLLAAGVSALVVHGGSAEQQAALLPALAAGELRASIAVADDGGPWVLDRIQARAWQDDDGWVLRGAKRFVLGAPDADVLLVAARTPDGHVTVLVVPAGTHGLTVEQLQPLDRTRSLGHVALDAVRASPLGAPDDAAHALAAATEVLAVGIACESVGGAQWCLDAAVRHALVREQFGRPIGSFQAVKHRCADMLTQLEMARSAAYSAAMAVDGDHPDRGLLVPLAKAACTDAFLAVAAATIQVHGAIGYTWEHDAHLYLRRARSLATWLGDADHHRERVLAALGV